MNCISEDNMLPELNFLEITSLVDKDGILHSTTCRKFNFSKHKIKIKISSFVEKSYKQKVCPKCEVNLFDKFFHSYNEYNQAHSRKLYKLIKFHSHLTSLNLSGDITQAYLHLIELYSGFSTLEFYLCSIEVKETFCTNYYQKIEESITNQIDREVLAYKKKIDSIIKKMVENSIINTPNKSPKNLVIFLNLAILNERHLSKFLRNYLIEKPNLCSNILNLLSAVTWGKGLLLSDKEEYNLLRNILNEFLLLEGYNWKEIKSYAKPIKYTYEISSSFIYEIILNLYSTNDSDLYSNPEKLVIAAKELY